MELDHTYLDESYRPGAGAKPFVSAHFAGDAGLSWLDEVAQRARQPRQEVKCATVRTVLRSCDGDLAARIRRGAEQAAIIIADERPFRTEAEEWLRNSRLGPHLRTAPDPILAKIEMLTRNHVNSMLLFHTPLSKVTEFVNGTHGIDEVRTRLAKHHNVRVFAGRVTSGFYEFVDREARRRAVRRIIEQRRFLFEGDFEAELLAEGDLMTRVFDNGNRVSVQAIDDLRSRAHEQLVQRGRLWLAAKAPVTIERDSESDRFLQACDVAAGMARELYESSDGLRKVCDRFKVVVVNGRVQPR